MANVFGFILDDDGAWEVFRKLNVYGEKLEEAEKYRSELEWYFGTFLKRWM